MSAVTGCIQICSKAGFHTSIILRQPTNRVQITDNGRIVKTVGHQKNSTNEPISTPAVTTSEKEVSAIERRIADEKKVRDSHFGITPHRQNYFLPVTYDSDPNTETYEFADEDEPNHFEVKFQLSFKLLVWDNMFRGKATFSSTIMQTALALG